MGRMIAKNKAAGEIETDLDDVVNNSAAAGGTIAAIAATAIVPVALVIRGVESDLAEARKVAAPLIATVVFTRGKASDVVHLVHDLTRNEVGRPAVDPHLSLLFPGGASHYIDGEASELPQRMELLADLFEMAIHPQLSAEHNQMAASKVRAAAKVHGDAIEAARGPVAKVTLLERTRTVMARSAHSAMASFKRLLKASGFTEAQIHEVIPSHARSDAKKPAAKAPSAAAPAAAAPAAEAPSADAPSPG